MNVHISGFPLNIDIDCVVACVTFVFANLYRLLFRFDELSDIQYFVYKNNNFTVNYQSIV